MSMFGLRETSEKTTELNILSDVTKMVEQLSGRTVTLIAPTQNQEKSLGFDEMLEGLPSGRIIAFQFKRPYSMTRPQGCTRFLIDTQQLQRLLFNFYRKTAYYVFVPYPYNSDIIQNRNTLLIDSMSIDAYDIPRASKIRQKTRTVRFYRSSNAGLMLLGLPANLEIADPRVFEKMEKAQDLKSICKKFAEGEIGLHNPVDKKKHDVGKNKKNVSLRNAIYIHLAD